MKKTVVEYAALHAEQTPDKKAIITPESSISFGYIILAYHFERSFDNVFSEKGQESGSRTGCFSYI